MKIQIILIALLFYIPVVVFSQKTESTEKNLKTKTQFSVFTEAFGNGGLVSANLDFTFFGARKTHFSLRTGIGGPFNEQLSIPTEISLLYGARNHFIETGFGMTFLYFGSVLNVLRIGYRYQNRKSGLLFRVGFTPYLFIDDFWSSGYKLNGGISIGYSF